MGRKSSKTTRANAVASDTAAAPPPPPARGSSTSHASLFEPPLHGSGSASASAPPSAIPTALPASIHRFPSQGASSAAGSPALVLPPGGSRAAAPELERPSVEKHILDLRNTDLRRNALKELAKMVAFPDMALFLWYSFGTIAILLQEVLCVYTMMSRSLLSVEQSTRACDVLALFQCVASHPSTKKLFTKANIPVYLCSFLSKNGEFRDFEHVRISTLGVIGALVKVPDTDVITSLLSSEIMPICLRAMENGTEMSRTVATFILHGLLQDPVGLQYICHLPVRLYAVLQSLGNVVASLSEKASARLLKQVVKCYLRFLDDRRSLMTLKSCFPKRLQDGTFEQCVREDQALRMGLQRLLDNVRGSSINRGSLINMLMWVLPDPKQL